MIECQDLRKEFRVYRKDPGIKGSLLSLFKRRYDTRAAVHGFDLTVGRGEMVGLLGPNGAGKTTLMKMFAGIIVPSQGRIKVAGHVPFEREQAFRKKIALVMGQKSQLWWDIPAMDSFLLLQKYYEIPERDFRKRLGELAALMAVEPMLKVHVRKLSLGERMKMELIACLLHQPEILFLDEPTIGLDLVAQRNMRDFIAAWQAQHRTTVILTSHYMADVDALCDRIVLVLDGTKRFDGSIHDFSVILGREKYVRVSFEQAVGGAEFFERWDPHWNETRTRVDLRIPESQLREVAVAILQNFPVTDFSMEQLPIERVMNALLANPHLLRGEAALG
ncbi:ABC transporter ATP-binding protein [Oligoflexus tunisiensis]|uniref:ABC transporter ATP-binding protein n=1 Tax=Oligoflexus tunisiensis TaxID=708132 RepID=UPI000AE95F73|nr:ATP-binding cassette domain-containing protein [Oligoflexus tunisiensis]